MRVHAMFPTVPGTTMVSHDSSLLRRPSRQSTVTCPVFLPRFRFGARLVFARVFCQAAESTLLPSLALGLPQGGSRSSAQ